MSRVSTSDFELPLPDGWSDRTAVTLAAPPTPDGYVANVVVTREPLCDHLGLGGFADGHANLLRQHASELGVLSTEEARLDGSRAIVRVIRFRIGDERALVQLQAFCVRDGVGYAICGTAAEESFAAVEPQLRATIDGFRFAGASALDRAGASAA